MSFGIPYADPFTDDLGGWFVLCPVCGECIELIERKDFESFTSAEYTRHYQAEHAKEAN